MPECDHCGERFDEEDAYLRHLADEHAGELGRIEQRRVAEIEATEEGVDIPTGPAVLLGVFAIAFLLVGYVIVAFGGGGGDSSGDLGPVGSAHEHGTMEMTVLGERVDFSQSRYQLAADRFHFESNNGRVWHKHATGVTLAWGMDTLGIDVGEGTVTYQGTTYRDSSDEYEVSVTVNGNSIDPETYVLEGVGQNQPPSNGDRVRIVVRRANASG